MSNRRPKSKNKPKRRRPPGAVTAQINTRRALERARDAFYEDDDPGKARRLMEQIESQGPMSYEAISFYLDILQEQREFDHYSRIATMMANRFPSDPIAFLLSASGACSTGQPVSAILSFERFLELAPEHPGAPTAREELAKLREFLPKLLDAFEDSLPKTLPRIASIEKVLHFIKLGRFTDVIKQCESHLELFPDDQRIRNNLAESLVECGHVTRALAVFNETIERFPGNFYARAARCRVLCLQAKFSDSDADAESLFSLEPKQASDLTKAAQAFAHRGEDERIEWAYQQADSRGWLQNPAPDVAVLLNLQATCRARAGDTQAAKSLWKKAEKMAPGATPAGENLNDMRQPVGHQWGPAFFGLRDWFHQEQQQALEQLIAPESPGETLEGRLDRVLNRFLKQYPSVEAIANRMLLSGDADCQQFAVVLVKQIRNPEISKVLLDYVQGSRGTDAIRQQLASELSQRGELPSSVITMHVRGKVDQIEFISFEITDEPSIPDGRSDEVCELIADAMDAIHDSQPEDAERLLRQVLVIHPDEPDVLNNLAMSLQLQNRMTEANQLIDEVIQKHPDYFFGKIAAANRLIQRKRFDQALDILVELQHRQRLHQTEFTALATSMIHVFVGKREFDGADRWLDMFAEYCPEHGKLDRLSNFIDQHRESST